MSEWAQCGMGERVHIDAGGAMTTARRTRIMRTWRKSLFCSSSLNFRPFCAYMCDHHITPGTLWHCTSPQPHHPPRSTLNTLISELCSVQKFMNERTITFRPLQTIHKNTYTTNISTINPLAPEHFVIALHPSKKELVIGEGMSFWWHTLPKMNKYLHQSPSPCIPQVVPAMPSTSSYTWSKVLKCHLESSLLPRCGVWSEIWDKVNVPCMIQDSDVVATEQIRPHQIM